MKALSFLVDNALFGALLTGHEALSGPGAVLGGFSAVVIYTVFVLIHGNPSLFLSDFIVLFLLHLCKRVRIIRRYAVPGPCHTVRIDKSGAVSRSLPITGKNRTKPAKTGRFSNLTLTFLPETIIMVHRRMGRCEGFCDAPCPLCTHFRRNFK